MSAANGGIKAATGARVVGPRARPRPHPGDRRDGRPRARPFRLGAAEAEIFFIPGHTRGHMAFWFQDSRALFCGDTLFTLGCGRLFEGTPQQMWASLLKLRALPDEAQVHCGHEYTESNARFALAIDPDNAALRRRAEQVKAARAARPADRARRAWPRSARPTRSCAPTSPRSPRRSAWRERRRSQVFAEIRRRKDKF